MFAATTRTPVLFIGHGSPMIAIEDNRWSRALRALGEALPTPRAFLAVSAHWYGPGTLVTGHRAPPTIHDFGGFPRALFEVVYPAPGDPPLAAEIAALFAGQVRIDYQRGLDHGVWSVLRHLRPAADVPVLQFSIDSAIAPAQHLALAARLRPLRDQGVMIFCTGNITHNLPHAFGALRSGETTTPPWAARFDADVTSALQRRDVGFLAEALASEEGRIAHPTPEHFLPLLYAAGAADNDDVIEFPIEGFDLASLSMRSVVFHR